MRPINTFLFNIKNYLLRSRFRKIKESNLFKKLLYRIRISTLRPKRFRNLLRIVYQKRCQIILEIGVYNGITASQMIETASIFYPLDQIEYYGFDLFEKMTNEDFQREFSRKPPKFEIVKKRLKETGAKIQLFMGYSQNTLPNFVEKINKLDKKIDLVFIDGGHSIETVFSDWNNVKKLMNPETIVIFDDFYNNDEKDLEGVGCQVLINSLNRNKYHIEFLRPEDQFQRDWGILKINMVTVKFKKNNYR